MPEPYSTYSTDRPVYYVANLFARHMLHVSPDIISIVGLLFMIPILKNLFYGGSTIEVVVLVIIKQFMDCLDGTVARMHNTGSEYGEVIDMICDVLGMIAYLWFAIYKFNKTKKMNYMMLSVICLLVYGVLDEFYDLYNITHRCKFDKNKKGKLNKRTQLCSYKKKYTFITKLFHDNSVLVQVIGVLVFKLN